MTEEILAESEAYFLRNRGEVSRSTADSVLNALKLVASDRSVSRILEVGSFDGRRLSHFASELKCEAVGVEASGSAVAISRERYPNLRVVHGVAPQALEEALLGECFDIVILGFFLYLLPREYLFRLASAVDSLVPEGGFLVVEDFHSTHPARKAYKHSDLLTTYKMDYSMLWTWNPQYTLLHRSVRDGGGQQTSFGDPDAWVAVNVIAKSSAESCYVVRP